MARTRVHFGDDDRAFRRFVKQLKALQGAEVLVGIHGEEGSEMVRIGAIHEFGAEWTITAKQAHFMARRLMGIDPEEEPGRYWGAVKKLTGRKMRIPERSYLRATVDTKAPQIQEAMRRTAASILAGERTAHEGLSRFGAFVQRLVQKTMTDLKRPANAPLTVALKGSANPLIDSGRLRASITFKVKNGLE